MPAPLRRSARLRAAVRAARRRRRRLFEALGSDRFSRPASHDLERKLAGYLPDRGGTFLEAGAYDGFTESNTYWFERMRGWTGVLVEPVPEMAAIARRERPGAQVFSCALVADDVDGATIRMQTGGTMSLVEGAGPSRDFEIAHAREGARLTHRDQHAIEVPARTLSAVLDEAGSPALDLMSLDVEGSEAIALEGLDLDRHAPRFLLVEMLHEEGQRGRIEAALGERYAHEAQLSVWDHLYRRIV